MVFPLTLGLAITRQSLWIDEGFTVWFASHSNIRAFFAALVGTRGAPGDPQFIFYLLHMWGWIKLFGSSELSLRAANIPFAAIFIAAIGWASRRLFWHRNLWVLFCLSPFFWFYLNEARPYVAVLAFSSVACVALLAYLTDPHRYGKTAPWFCLVALFIGWGMHILTFFLFPVLLILAVSTLAGNRELASRFFHNWRRPFLCCLPAFVALGAFYLRVSANGVSKTEGEPSLANLAFALYEFSGFAGLGPPRNDIRQTQHLAVFLPYSAWLLIAAAILAAVVWSAFRRARGRITRNLFISVLCGFAIALVVSRLQHFQVLGRHLAALFPALFMVAMLAPRRASSSRASQRALASFAALALVWGISDIRLVLLGKYKKDSYREACAIALAKSRSEGSVIIWAADAFTAQYYGLTVGDTASPSRSGSNWGIGPGAFDHAVSASTWSFDRAAAHLATSSVPTILVLSRPDTFDPDGTWRALMRERQPAVVAHLNALSIFEWRPNSDAACSVCESASLPLRELLPRTPSREDFLENGGSLPAESSQLDDTL